MRRKIDRYLAGRDLLQNRTGRNAYTRLIHFLGTYRPIRRTIEWVRRHHPRAFGVLHGRYQPYTKFRV
jgi:hypothetical protein